MITINLNKGDSVVLCAFKGGKYVPCEAVIRARRVYKNGGCTYWVTTKDGVKVSRSFNEYGSANFSDWRDAAWTMHPCFICATMKEAKRACK